MSQNLRFQSYTVENGLPQNSVFCLHEDKIGYLWIGTGDGLVRFDGYNLIKYSNNINDSCSIKNNFIRKIVETPKGNLIIQTDKNVEFFDIKKQCFKTLLSIEEMRIKHISSTLIGGNDSVAWCFSSIGFMLKLDILNNSQERIELPRNNYGGFFYEGLLKIGDKMYLNLDSGLYQYNINTNQLSLIYMKKYVNKSNLALTGDNLCFNDGNKVLYYNYKKNKIQYISNDLLHTSKITAVYTYQGNTLYITLANNQILCYSNSKLNYILENDENDVYSLTNNTLKCFLKDKNNNIWVGSDGGGLQKANKNAQSFNHIKLNKYNTSKRPVMVKSFCSINDSVLYIGTVNYGLKCLNLRNNKEIEIKDNLKLGKITVYSICDYKDILILGTNIGILHFDKKLKKYIHSNIPIFKASVNGLEIFKNKLYITNDSGVFEFDFNIKTLIKRSLIKASKYIYTTHDEYGNLWATSLYEGIYIYKKDTIIHINNKNGLPNESVRCIIKDIHNNTFWVATEGGLCHIYFNHKTNTYKIKNYRENEGLANAYIYGIVCLPNSDIWLSTNKGLSCFNKLSNKFKNYDLDDGIQSNEFNTGAFGKNNEGYIYFGGINGINVFRSEQSKSKVNSHLVITKLTIGDKNYLEVLDGQTFETPYTSSQISIDFSLLDLTSSSKNVFEYKLIGVDDKWQKINNSHTLYFSSLQPGDYVMSIKGYSPFSNDDEKVISFKIKILPPWYKTWWFVSVIVLVGLSILLYIFYYISTIKLRKQIAIIERQKEVERLRARISSDIHDDIGAGLSKISLYSEIAQSQINNPLEMKNKLTKISSDSRELMNNMREIVWAMNPENDSLKSLLAYMNEYAINYLEHTSIQLEFELPIIENDIKVLPDFKRNIYMILKETLSNSVKYSQCTRINISFELNQDIFKFIIKDNGIGINEATKRKFSNGLGMMKKRAKDIEAELQIDSTEFVGTNIILTGKLN